MPPRLGGDRGLRASRRRPSHSYKRRRSEIAGIWRETEHDSGTVGPTTIASISNSSKVRSSLVVRAE